MSVYSARNKAESEIERRAAELLKSKNQNILDYVTILEAINLRCESSEYTLKLCDKVLMFQKLLAREKANILYFKACYYQRVGQNGEAVKHYRDAENIYRQNGFNDQADEILSFEFNTLVHMNSIEAGACFDKLSKKKNTLSTDAYQYPSICYALATYCLSRGHFEEAIKLLDDFLNHYKADEEHLVNIMDAYLRMGQAYHFLEDYDKAQRCFDDVITNPQTSIFIKITAMLEYAQIYRKSNDLESSNSFIDAALELSAQDTSINKSELLRLKKDNLESAGDFDDASSIIIPDEIINSISGSKFEIKTRSDIAHLQNIRVLASEFSDSHVAIQGELLNTLKNICKHFSQMSRITKENYAEEGDKTTEGKPAPDGIRKTLTGLKDTGFSDLFENFSKLQDILSSCYSVEFAKRYFSSDSGAILKNLQIVIDLIFRRLFVHEDYKPFFSDKDITFYNSKPEQIISTSVLKSFFSFIDKYNNILHIQNIIINLDKAFNISTTGRTVEIDFFKKADEYTFSHLITLMGEHAKNISPTLKCGGLKDFFVILADLRDIFAKRSYLTFEGNSQSIIHFKVIFLSVAAKTNEILSEISKLLHQESLEPLEEKLYAVGELTKEIAKTYKSSAQVIDKAHALEKVRAMRDILEYRIQSLKSTHADVASEDSRVTFYRSHHSKILDKILKLNLKEAEKEFKVQEEKEIKLKQELTDARYPNTDVLEADYLQEKLHWSVTWCREYKFLTELCFKEKYEGRIEAIRGVINYLNVSMRQDYKKEIEEFFGGNAGYAKEHNASVISKFIYFRNQKIAHGLLDLLKDFDIDREVLSLIQSNVCIVSLMMCQKLADNRTLKDYWSKEGITVEYAPYMNEAIISQVYSCYYKILQYKFNNYYADLLKEFQKIADFVLIDDASLVINNSDIIACLLDIILDASIITSESSAVQDASISIDTLLKKAKLHIADKNSNEILRLTITILRYHVNNLMNADNERDFIKHRDAISDILNSDLIAYVNFEKNKQYYLSIRLIECELFIHSEEYQKAQTKIDDINKALMCCSDKQLKLEYTVKASILLAEKNIAQDPSMERLEFYHNKLKNELLNINKYKLNFASKERAELLVQQLKHFIDSIVEKIEVIEVTEIKAGEVEPYMLSGYGYDAFIVE